MLCNLLDFVNSGKEIISLLFGLVALILAYCGLANWRIQLNGSNKIKNAKELLREAYKVKKAFNFVRITTIFEYELAPSEDDVVKYRYSNRINYLTETINKFEDIYLNVFIDWSLKDEKYLDAIKIKYFEWVNAVELYVNYNDLFRQNIFPEQENITQIVFSKKENDVFFEDIEKINNEMEKWLKPIYEVFIIRFKNFLVKKSKKH